MWPWRCFIQAEESKWASSASPRAGCAASQIWRKTFPAAVYVRNVTTIPYAFQFKGYSVVWLPAGPPTAARTCLLPESAVPRSKPLETLWLKLGGVEVKGGGLMSADTPAPSLGDNRASESKLSSVCTAGPREHRRRADLCPRIHMFSIKCFFLYLEHFQWSTVCRQKTNNFKEGRGQVTLFLNGGTNQICVSRPKIWMIICPSNRSVNPGWHARWGADELAV